MSSSEVGRKFVFWVVYDATGDRQFVKMDSDTGCLAMFDNEESAAAFASGLVGVGYREVVLYSCPQPDAAERQAAPDMPGLTEALRQYHHNNGSGFVFAYDRILVDRHVAWLVEALECALETMENVDGANDCSRGIDAVEEALATHRKQGGEV